MFGDAKYSGGGNRRNGAPKSSRFNGFGAKDYRQTSGGGGGSRNNGPSGRPGGYGGQFSILKKTLTLFLPQKQRIFQYSFWDYYKFISRKKDVQWFVSLDLNLFIRFISMLQKVWKG